MYNVLLMNDEAKNCHSCKKPIRGRVDKKFCDDFCRNTYNNQLKSERNNFVRNVNNALRKNRRILEELLPENTTAVSVSKKVLTDKGFHFRFFTHTYINPAKDHYYYCYDYGYRPLENNYFMVVRNKKNEV